MGAPLDIVGARGARWIAHVLIVSFTDALRETWLIKDTAPHLVLTFRINCYTFSATVMTSIGAFSESGITLNPLHREHCIGSLDNNRPCPHSVDFVRRTYAANHLRFLQGRRTNVEEKQRLLRSIAQFMLCPFHQDPRKIARGIATEWVVERQTTKASPQFVQYHPLDRDQLPPLTCS